MINPGVMGLNPSKVELWVHCPSVLSDGPKISIIQRLNLNDIAGVSDLV